jgi:hypothetical protein
MRPLIIGRVLGTGVRVAGKIAGERLMGDAPSGAVQSRQSATTSQQSATAVRGDRNQARPQVQDTARNVRQAASQVQGGIAQGVGGFLRPFKRVGGILWLEVTGALFLLPAIAFSPNLWRMRASWAHGPDHITFLITAGVVVVFFYLGVSSFWRARRR